MDYKWFDFVGNLGVICILAAFIMLQLNKLDSKDKKYNLLNALGAILILVSLVFEFNMSAFIMEAFWLIFSIYGLMKSNRA